MSTIPLISAAPVTNRVVIFYRSIPNNQKIIDTSTINYSNNFNP